MANKDPYLTNRSSERYKTRLGRVAASLIAIAALVGTGLQSENPSQHTETPAKSEIAGPSQSPLPQSATEAPYIEAVAAGSLLNINGAATATKIAVRIKPPAPTHAPRVVHIGDSIGVLKFTYGNYAQLLADGGVELTAHDEKGARPLIWFPCDQSPDSLACEADAWLWTATTHHGAGDGIRSLVHMQPEVIDADVVVVNLGQNTLESDLEDDEMRVLGTAYDMSNIDGVPAVIITSNMAHTNSSYVGPASSRNEKIKNVVSILNGEGKDVRILDVAGQNIALDSGGIHPAIPRGASQLAQYEAAQIIQIAYEVRNRNG